MFYAPGLLGYSIVKIASPTFYSLRDSRTPVAISVASVLTNLALNVALVRVLGFRGLALGTATAALLNAAILLWLLRRRLGGLDSRPLLTAAGKIAIASAVMGAVGFFGVRWLEQTLPGRGELLKAVRVSTAIAASLLALAASARVLRIEEFSQASKRILRRLMPGRS
jgi:putative peptidoglycan lipid II flippase